MDKKNMTIQEWIGKFLTGKFDSSDLDTQIGAGWYDWFCKDETLAKRTKKLGKKLIEIAKSNKFDVSKTYVFFKNNCPCNGSLYDDFRICEIESGAVLYTIIPSSGFKVSKGNAEVWGVDNNFEKPIVEGTWKDVKKFFNV